MQYNYYDKDTADREEKTRLINEIRKKGLYEDACDECGFVSNLYEASTYQLRKFLRGGLKEGYSHIIKYNEDWID